MAGLLDIQSPEGQALFAAQQGLLAPSRGIRGVGQAVLLANQAFAMQPALQRQLEMERKKMSLLDAQIAETQAQASERSSKAKRDMAELERQANIGKEIPSLFGRPGLTGGEAAPQEIGGVPMFSKPMGVTPMQQSPGGFNLDRALQLRMTPKEIADYAALQDVGRPKATRQMEVDDGKGGKRLALVDDYGRVVAGFDGYTAPVQVNRGNTIDFVKPTPGASFSVGMSPAERDASARGWATVNQGKVPSGYRAKPDGTLEFIPGGPADPAAAKRAAPTEDERKAAGWLSQAQKGLADMKAAVQVDPSANKPSIIEAMPFVPENTVNMTRSPARQMFNQGASALGEAVLRAATGAGVNRDEAAQKARELTPQWGDSETVIAQKAASAENYIRALEVRAGRAGGPTTPGKASTPDNDPLGLRR